MILYKFTKMTQYFTVLPVTGFPEIFVINIIVILIIFQVLLQN